MKKLFLFAMVSMKLVSCVVSSYPYPQQGPVIVGGGYPQGGRQPNYGQVPQTSICGNVDLTGVPVTAMQYGDIVAARKYDDFNVKVRVIPPGEMTSLNKYGRCIFKDMYFTYKPANGQWWCTSESINRGNPCQQPMM